VVGSVIEWPGGAGALYSFTARTVQFRQYIERQGDAQSTSVASFIDTNLAAMPLSPYNFLKNVILRLTNIRAPFNYMKSEERWFR
jgi:hypothetical protein